MNSKILCNWLGILDWPPDHYSLLGLKPGEEDAARIEHQVHERMAKLRCYQCSYPEEATEGMNRLAQAFICLTDALSKPRRSENGKNGQSGQATLCVAVADTQPLLPSLKNIEVDWKNAPPPVRMVTEQSGPAKTATTAQSSPASVSTTPAAPLAEPTASIGAPALEHTEALRGLGTLPALIERINQTRKFILAWNQAGKYLSNPGKKLTRPAEDAELTRRLNKVFELTADFPKIVGHPGQPGYRVVAMARLEMTAQMFKMLDPTQRECMARDWEAGYRVLLCHRRFLHAQFKHLRSRGPVSLVLKAIRGALNDHPVWVSVAVLLTVGLCILLYRKMF